MSHSCHAWGLNLAGSVEVGFASLALQDLYTQPLFSYSATTDCLHQIKFGLMCRVALCPLKIYPATGNYFHNTAYLQDKPGLLFLRRALD